MKKIKNRNIVYISVSLVLLYNIMFSMAKKYPLPTEENVQQNEPQNVIQINPTNVVVEQNNVSEKELRHGINLKSLPVKNDYKIGLVNLKNGLIAPTLRYVPAAEQMPSSAKERVVYAIYELLKGPSEEEKSKGYASLIPEGTKLLNCEVVVDDFGVRVKLEFSEEILKDIDEIKNVLIQDQITYTLISLDIPKIYGCDVYVKGKPLGYYASGGR
jgi:spore germination protein GerM